MNGKQEFNGRVELRLLEPGDFRGIPTEQFRFDSRESILSDSSSNSSGVSNLCEILSHSRAGIFSFSTRLDRYIRVFELSCRGVFLV